MGRSIALAALIAVAGCDDGPPAMPANDDPWHASELPSTMLGTGLTAIAFGGERGVILGVSGAKAGTDYVLMSRDAGGLWQRALLQEAPDNAVLLDLAVDADGLAMGGYLQQDLDPCLVYDERGELPTSIARVGQAIEAIDGDGTLMVAAGRALGGALWLSREPGHWSPGTSPLDPAHDAGFSDVFVGNGRVLACGYAEGADTLQVVLSLDAVAGTWSRLSLGTGVGGLTLRCVAADGEGTVMVGGLVTGDPAPRGFLRRRDPAGNWSDVPLPDGHLLGGVNDLLPADGGVWYVACGGEGGIGLATVLRVDAAGATYDLTPFNGSLTQMARDQAGRPHAVGYRLSAGAALRLPLLLTRD